MLHPTAIISPKAELGKEVEVGPYCVIEDGVKIKDGSKLFSHVALSGDTEIGTNCEIYPFTTIGYPPQDLKYQGEASRTIIGNHSIIREHVTINRGTKDGIMETRIGDHCLIMACAHIAHDCVLGDHVILANSVLLAGHCELGNHVFFGGASICRQFLHIGEHAYISGASALAGHVPPYISALGTPAVFTNVNAIGLKRHGFSSSEIHSYRKFYQLFFSGQGTPQARLAMVEKEFSASSVGKIIDFIKSCVDLPHGFIQPRRKGS